MTRKFDPAILVAFIVSCLLIAFTSIYSVWSNNRFLQSSKELQKVNLTMKNLEDVVMQSNELILAYRGYALSGRESYLQQYQSAHNELTRLDSVFEELGKSNKAITPTSVILIDSVRQLLQHGDRIIEKRKAQWNGEAPYVVKTQRGEGLRSSIDLMVVTLENEGRKQLRTLEAEQQDLVKRNSIINYGLAAFSLILIVYVFTLLQQRFNRKQESMARLRDTNVQLGKEVRQKDLEILHVFERITDGFVSIDNNWNFTHVNNRAVQLLKKNASELIGQSVWSMFPEVVETPFAHAFRKAMEEQKYVHGEDFYAPLNVWFEVHVYPATAGVSIFFRDVSKRKNAEAEKQRVLDELSKSEARLRTIFDTTETSYALLDAQLKIISFNHKAQQFAQREFGSTLRVGESVTLALPTERLENLLLMIKEAGTGKQLSIEREYKQPDGSSHWYIAGVYRVNADKGEGGGYNILVSVQDITEQKLASAKIAYERNLSESIINSLPGIFYLANTEGRLIRWNKNYETVSGYTAEELAAMRVIQFVSEDEQSLLLNKKIQAIQEGSSATNLNFKCKSGNTLPYFFTSWLTVYEGKPALLGVGMDMTDRVKAENELRQSHEQLRQLSSHLQTVREEERTGIAREIHDELGQQLTGLKMDVTWLGKKINSESEFVKEKIDSIVSLIDDIIKTVRKISSDLRPGVLDDLGLVAALEWQSSEFQKRSGIKLAFHSKVEDIHPGKDVTTGVFRIYQEALTNIMRHASATQVTSSLEHTGNMLVLSVSDNGKGFDPATTAGRKTLGLIGMKERAFMMGGELEITSVDGKGTSLTLKVPILPKTQTTA